MAIRFEDKKPGGTPSKPAPPKAEPAPERPKPPAEAFPAATSPAEGNPELPFGKAAKPEKKARKR